MSQSKKTNLFEMGSSFSDNWSSDNKKNQQDKDHVNEWGHIDVLRIIFAIEPIV